MEKYYRKGLDKNEEQRDKLEQLMQKTTEAKGISRQYIQDLYRFFKLWIRHREEEDIFRWKFNLWENPLLGDALQQENIIKEWTRPIRFTKN